MAKSRVTKKDLEELTRQLNEKENRPTTYSGPELETGPDGREYPKINVGHIILDHAACYGGYALREVSTPGGGQSFYWPSWTRVSAREMYYFLLGKLAE